MTGFIFSLVTDFNRSDIKKREGHKNQTKKLEANRPVGRRTHAQADNIKIWWAELICQNRDM